MAMRLWSSDELEAMKRMRAEGKTLEEIARAPAALARLFSRRLTASR